MRAGVPWGPDRDRHCRRAAVSCDRNRRRPLAVARAAACCGGACAPPPAPCRPARIGRPPRQAGNGTRSAARAGPATDRAHRRGRSFGEDRGRHRRRARAAQRRDRRHCARSARARLERRQHGRRSRAEGARRISRSIARRTRGDRRPPRRARRRVSRANQAELAKRAAPSADDARSRLAIAALSLRNAVESGAPFTAELSAVRALSGDAKTIAALEPFAQSGVPTAAESRPRIAGDDAGDLEGGARRRSGRGQLPRAAAGQCRQDRAHPSRRRGGRRRCAEREGAASNSAPAMPISAARWPNSPSCRRMRARRRRPGSRRPKRAMPRIAAAQSLAQSALAALAKSGS